MTKTQARVIFTLDQLIGGLLFGLQGFRGFLLKGLPPEAPKDYLETAGDTFYTIFGGGREHPWLIEFSLLNWLFPSFSRKLNTVLDIVERDKLIGISCITNLVVSMPIILLAGPVVGLLAALVTTVGIATLPWHLTFTLCNVLRKYSALLGDKGLLERSIFSKIPSWQDNRHFIMQCWSYPLAFIVALPFLLVSNTIDVLATFTYKILLNKILLNRHFWTWTAAASILPVGPIYFSVEHTIKGLNATFVKPFTEGFNLKSIILDGLLNVLTLGVFSYIQKIGKKLIWYLKI